MSTEITLKLEYRDFVFMFFCFSVLYEEACWASCYFILNYLTYWSNLVFRVFFQFHLHVLQSSQYWSNSSKNSLVLQKQVLSYNRITHLCKYSFVSGFTWAKLILIQRPLPKVETDRPEGSLPAPGDSFFGGEGLKVSEIGEVKKCPRPQGATKWYPYIPNRRTGNDSPICPLHCPGVRLMHTSKISVMWFV